ncbi:PLAT/LH2 domain-containing lipoxygenase family protein [Perilla frutescens var. frutescens]|nr:PLAT/LH2 domain-containing lipoxygenase family protein [Perilla frutescens var. frutescens]
MGIFPPCQSSEVLEKLTGSVCGKIKDEPKIEKRKIKGTVVLMKKNVMDVTDVGASFIDRIYEIFGKGISLQLISALHFDPGNQKRGKLGNEAYLEDWVLKLTSLNAGDEASYDVNFDWDESLGLPGAFIIRNRHRSQIYLKTVTLEDVPGHGPVHFLCDSWVYPTRRYDYDRVFFSNKTYLPSETPAPLLYYREQDLKNLRGSGSGELKEWDRVYDYAYYNDLGSPEKDDDHARPVLGGSTHPYPRRARTGRPPNKKDPNTESRLFLLNLNIYVPRDEKFSHVKFSDFIGYAIKSLGQVLVPEIKAVLDKTINEFDTFKDVEILYGDGIELPEGHSLEKIRQCVPWELLRELLRSDGERFLTFPLPEVIKGDKTAWRTDEEFGREMLAGVNPVIIRRLEEFPPRSKLDRQEYGNQDSTITREHIEKNMNGLTVDEALEKHKLFILDHHDALMLYLRRINTTATKTYATRTLLLLQDDGTLKPLAIELSLPHEDGDSFGAKSQVFTPCDQGVGAIIWQLAKAYAAVNDSGYHQLISHWLNTHAVIEPFAIATNRQLSVLHPIYKLLKPHFRDTIHINALARHTLINAGGVLETTVFPAKYAMEMSSAVYRNWNFTEQALPQDLIKRGLAVPDTTKPHGLRLLIEDYPFAVDGLEIWSAIKTWVADYCSFYYPTDEKVIRDTELQLWWKEVREVGHGDLREKPWWPKIETRTELIETCTIIIWVASALHAAVNFGQYAYAGYLPNRPTVSRRFMPEPGSSDYEELEKDEEAAFLKTITAQFQTLLGVSLIEMLSRHSTDEIYLGQRESRCWTGDEQPLEAFDRFSAALIEIEKKIVGRNADLSLKNRTGPVGVDYMLLYPNTSDYSRNGGLNVKGIPNSVSI